MTIKTETEYRDALREIEGLMSATRPSAEGDRLNELVAQVERYERELGLDALLLNSPSEKFKLTEEDRQWMNMRSTGKEI